jgi:predicted RNA-binding protein with PUA-like domain
MLDSGNTNKKISDELFHERHKKNDQNYESVQSMQSSNSMKNLFVDDEILHYHSLNKTEEVQTESESAWKK